MLSLPDKSTKDRFAEAEQAKPCVAAEAPPSHRSKAAHRRNLNVESKFSLPVWSYPYAGNETARPQDEIADGASELRRGGRSRERERHAQARAHVRDS